MASGPQLKHNKEVMRSFFEDVWQGGQLDLLDDLIHDDFRDNGIAPAKFKEGREGARAAVEMFRTAMPGLTMRIDDMLAEGDLVLTRWTGRGVNNGPMETKMGVQPPTGREASVTGVTINRLKDNRIIEAWDSYDMVGMMVQLGVIPPPKSGPGGDRAVAGKGEPVDPPGDVGASTREANNALVRQFFDRAWNRGDLTFFDDHYSPDFVLHVLWHNIELGGPVDAAGIDAAREAVGKWVEDFPDIHVTVDIQVAEGDRVGSYHRSSGTHVKDFQGVPPTGVRFEMVGITITRVHEGKVTEAWTSWDAMGLMRQLKEAAAAT